LEDLSVDGRIKLNWFFKKWDWEAWNGLIWLKGREIAGGCECCNELSDSIKFGKNS